MAIKKRISYEEQVRRTLPKGWRAVVRHPLIRSLMRGKGSATPIWIAEALRTTSKWKGATWHQKVFTIAFDIILERGYGEGVLDADTYNRLMDHLSNNDNKIHNDDWKTWHVFVWDIYHDGMKLLDLEPGALNMQPWTPARRRLKKAKHPRRRKVTKS